MTSTPFIYETTNNRLRRLVAISILLAIILVGVAILVINLHNAKASASGDTWYAPFVPDLVNDITPMKLLLISFLGGTIFFPIPTELAFYFSIIQGNSPVTCVLFATFGFVLGNVVNYLIGLKLSNHIMYLLSAKAFFKMRRQVNRWGVYAVLLLNLIPAPSDVLAVALGTVRYNPRTLFFFSVLGNTIKFIAIAVIAYATKGLF